MPKSATRFRDGHGEGDGEGEGERMLSASCKRETSNRDSVVPQADSNCHPCLRRANARRALAAKCSESPPICWVVE